MHLRSYRIQNYRRLRDVHIEFAKDISIFVGANNSAKTSATQAIEMFLSGRKAATPAALASGLHKRVIGQHFDKTKFALSILARKDEDWTVPRYIAQGVKWLESVVDLETTQEIEAAAEGIAIELAAGPEPAGEVNE